MISAKNSRKIALVTGAGTGIGLAVSKGLANDDYFVILAGRKIKKLEEAAKDIGENAYPLMMDVSDPKSIFEAFSWIETKIGRLDLLFNNAGTGIPGTISLEDIEVDEWERVVATNLSGSFYCIQGAFRIMKSQKPIGGRIINNGSISAFSPRPGTAAYSTSKHAVSGLTKAISLDGRKDRIVCSQINIGNAMTNLTKDYRGVMAALDKKDGKI